MQPGFEILCANKNYAGLIIELGGQGWHLSVREAVMKLMQQQLRLHVLVDGQPVEVGIRGSGFDAYLVLEPDGFPLHQLTDLPGC